MDIIVPLAFVDTMLASSSIAEPDTTQGETSWSSGECNIAGDERIVAAPSGTVTISNSSPCIVTYTGHVLTSGIAVQLTTSGTLPTGLVVNQVYYISTLLDANRFYLTDADGRTVNTTGAGSGTHTLTATVHKVYQAALGTSLAISSVDTGVDEFTTVSAHGFTGNGTPVCMASTGTLPSPLVANTLYYINTTGTTTFKLRATPGGSTINITTTGSGTITVLSGDTTGPNLNKPPLQNPTWWTEVSGTNKWGMFDNQLGSLSEATSSL